MTAPPVCRTCGGPILSRGHARQKRAYCSRPCFFDATRALPTCGVCFRRMPWGKGKHACHGPPASPKTRLEPPPSPHRVDTWGALPPACPRCAGAWRPIPGGVGCLRCGWDTFVAAALPGGR